MRRCDTALCLFACFVCCRDACDSTYQVDMKRVSNGSFKGIKLKAFFCIPIDVFQMISLLKPIDDQIHQDVRGCWRTDPIVSPISTGDPNSLITFFTIWYAVARDSKKNVRIIKSWKYSPITNHFIGCSYRNTWSGRPSIEVPIVLNVHICGYLDAKYFKNSRMSAAQWISSQFILWAAK